MRFILSFLFIASCFTGIQAQGIEFFHGTWEEALAEAKKQDKILFVDAYAKWCGPCKRMAAQVFPLKEVGDVYNENFINLKLDCEKADGMTFRKKYPVQAFPTLYFLDPNGEIVHRTKGGRQADGLIALANEAMSKYDSSADYAVEYEKGNREPELVMNYVKALNKSGKPSLKVANDYIRSQKDMSTPENLKFILEATSEADSKIFDMLIKNKSAITALVGKEVVDKQIEKACNKTLAKAIEFESTDLFNEAKDKYSKNLPSKSEKFATNANLDYYKACKDCKNYLKSITTYVKKEAKNDASKLNKAAMDIAGTFNDDPKAMKIAEKYASKAATNGGLSKYYLSYAHILLKNGKKSEALGAAEKALEKAEGGPNEKSAAEQLINKIKQG